MRDWRRLGRERLPPLALPGAREEEIYEELAQQLEQTYDEARTAGAEDAEAMGCALAQMGDWRQLAAEIVAAELDAGLPKDDGGGASDSRQRTAAGTPAAGPRPAAAAPAAVPAGRRRGPMGRAWGDLVHDLRHGLRS